MDPRSSYQASALRIAELHRQAEMHRLARQARDGEMRRLRSRRRWLARRHPERAPTEAPVPVAVEAASGPVKPH
jgi:hypothetical protein